MGEPLKIRQNVYLAKEVVRDLRDAFKDSSGSTHGAIQAALARGADLVLKELKGKSQIDFTNDERNGTTEPASNPALTPGTPDEVQQVLMVLEILRSGNPDAIEGMKHGVRLFYRFIGKDPDNVVVGSARGGSGDTGAEELGGTPQATPAVGSVHRVPDKDVRTRAGRPRAAAQRGPGNK